MTDLGLEVDTERGGVEFFAQFRSWAPRVNAYAESMKSEVTLGHDNGTRTDASRQYEASQAVEGMRTQLGALAERVASLETFANGTSLKQICRVAKSLELSNEAALEDLEAQLSRYGYDSSTTPDWKALPLCLQEMEDARYEQDDVPGGMGDDGDDMSAHNYIESNVLTPKLKSFVDRSPERNNNENTPHDLNQGSENPRSALAHSTAVNSASPVPLAGPTGPQSGTPLSERSQQTGGRRMTRQDIGNHGRALLNFVMSPESSPRRSPLSMPSAGNHGSTPGMESSTPTNPRFASPADAAAAAGAAAALNVSVDSMATPTLPTPLRNRSSTASKQSNGSSQPSPPAPYNMMASSPMAGGGAPMMTPNPGADRGVPGVPVSAALPRHWKRSPPKTPLLPPGGVGSTGTGMEPGSTRAPYSKPSTTPATAVATAALEHTPVQDPLEVSGLSASPATPEMPLGLNTGTSRGQGSTSSLPPPPPPIPAPSSATAATTASSAAPGTPDVAPRIRTTRNIRRDTDSPKTPEAPSLVTHPISTSPVPSASASAPTLVDDDVDGEKDGSGPGSSSPAGMNAISQAEYDSAPGYLKYQVGLDVLNEAIAAINGPGIALHEDCAVKESDLLALLEPIVGDNTKTVMLGLHKLHRIHIERARGLVRLKMDE